MPTHPKVTAAKRQRERDKAEKRKEKELRRTERKKTKDPVVRNPDDPDPDLEGMRPGPQAPLYY
ncbi:MAG: hypothetical protein EPO64_10755 [Nitrospirae bacterium]|nr:MAG: hypothetical protein EPO64_10755 [Nitrospirota bacterium]